MGIYIKGMTLDEFTSLDGNIGDFVNDEQLDVIEVPEPHGRLIDADKLYLVIKRHHDLYNGATNASDKARRDENLQVMCDIVDAPTVIEVDGE